MRVTIYVYMQLVLDNRDVLEARELEGSKVNMAGVHVCMACVGYIVSMTSVKHEGLCPQT